MKVTKVKKITRVVYYSSTRGSPKHDTATLVQAPLATLGQETRLYTAPGAKNHCYSPWLLMRCCIRRSHPLLYGRPAVTFLVAQRLVATHTVTGKWVWELSNVVTWTATKSHIESEVWIEKAHPNYGALSRQGLDPINVAYNRTCRYASSPDNRAETIASTQCTYPRRVGQVEWPGWIQERQTRQMWSPNTSSNRARQSATLLMWPTSLPLRQA